MHAFFTVCMSTALQNSSERRPPVLADRDSLFQPSQQQQPGFEEAGHTVTTPSIEARSQHHAADVPCTLAAPPGFEASAAQSKVKAQASVPGSRWGSAVLQNNVSCEPLF